MKVYQHLVDIQKENSWSFTLPEDNATKKHRRKKGNYSLDLEIITRELSGYLVRTGQSNDYGRQNVVEFMEGLNQYSLMKIEKLEILNRLPRTIVSLFSVIEECDQRFNEDQCNDMLELVQRCFPVAEEIDNNDEILQEVEEEEEEEDVVMVEQFEEQVLEQDNFSKGNEDEEDEDVVDHAGACLLLRGLRREVREQVVQLVQHVTCAWDGCRRVLWRIVVVVKVQQVLGLDRVVDDFCLCKLLELLQFLGLQLCVDQFAVNGLDEAGGRLVVDRPQVRDLVHQLVQKQRREVVDRRLEHRQLGHDDLLLQLDVVRGQHSPVDVRFVSDVCVFHLLGSLVQNLLQKFLGDGSRLGEVDFHDSGQQSRLDRRIGVLELGHQSCESVLQMSNLAGVLPDDPHVRRNGITCVESVEFQVSDDGDDGGEILGRVSSEQVLQHDNQLVDERVCTGNEQLVQHIDGFFGNLWDLHGQLADCIDRLVDHLWLDLQRVFTKLGQQQQSVRLVCESDQNVDLFQLEI
ncbi:hypothetical protein OGAPHI_005010 [Ogataea philodendri]|uniref:DNA-directed RNA polymerase III subunit RPC9 n=1 Tax=Ogataea philodendri TaxID=1378263 RepID=A0A9P8P1Z4_9ASCO|nr:uncharacterized protein OGAPHI_005010 [Ogataea philodendri]KAH3663609.1 hypothetical protein OGAPHI_005010 [Ogataea philodendri]